MPVSSPFPQAKKGMASSIIIGYHHSMQYCNKGATLILAPNWFFLALIVRQMKSSKLFMNVAAILNEAPF